MEREVLSLYEVNKCGRMASQATPGKQIGCSDIPFNTSEDNVVFR